MNGNLPIAIARCDVDGSVESILADSDGLFAALKPDENLLRLFDATNLDKALRFLEAVRSEAPPAPWEMTTLRDGVHLTLLLSGIRDGNSLYIAATIEEDSQARQLEDMARIVSEQAAALRMATKGQYQLATSQFQGEFEGQFDNLSRLNNELVNLQRELMRKNHELERLNQLKNEFLGMAAHDLRNPLGIINLYSAYLLEELDPALPADLAALVAEIQTASEFMVALVDDLLDLSIIESGKLQLELTPVDVVALVQQNVRRNQVLANRKAIRLDLTVDPDLPPVTLDTTKIEQVLNNLIGNAVKYSPAASVVRVYIARVGDAVAISIADSGPGIPAEEWDRLFRPFTRLTARPTGGEKSSGLGLAICRRIVEGHRGTLDLTSTDGAGSTFVFTLPINSATVPVEMAVS